jgi:hypothetical protein
MRGSGAPGSARGQDLVLQLRLEQQQPAAQGRHPQRRLASLHAASAQRPSHLVGERESVKACKCEGM